MIHKFKYCCAGYSERAVRVLSFCFFFVRVWIGVFRIVMFTSPVSIYHFHCLSPPTQAGVVELIEEHGVDERFGQLDGLFGAGNYFAENASKVRWRPCLLVSVHE